jgi:hypothetical protein
MNCESSIHRTANAYWFRVVTLALLLLTSVPPALHASAREDSIPLAQSGQKSAIFDVQGIEVDTRMAQVKSRAELDAYLREDSNQDHPLFALSEDGLRQFLGSLVFTERGLASFNASALEAELTATQIYRVLSLFGLQRMAPLVAAKARVETGLDRSVIDLASTSEFTNSPLDVACPVIENTECTPPATCRSAFQAWCVTCNCGMDPP